VGIAEIGPIVDPERFLDQSLRMGVGNFRARLHGV
jgi:hypothetical protein